MEGDEVQRTDFDVKTAVGSQEVVHTLSNAFLQGGDLLCFIRCEVEFVVEGYEEGLRVMSRT